MQQASDASERLVAPSDLIGRDDIAARLGVVPQRVAAWAARPEFPAPVTRLGRQFVYLWTEVSAWHERYSASKSVGGRPRVERKPRTYCVVKNCTNAQTAESPFCRKHLDQLGL